MAHVILPGNSTPVAHSLGCAAGAQPVWGDLKDRASLDAAGVDTVITTANGVKRGGEDIIETVDRQGTLNLIDAAQQAGVGRFLYTSVQGATLDNPNRLWQIKAECEQAVKQGGWTYTR